MTSSPRPPEGAQGSKGPQGAGTLHCPVLQMGKLRRRGPETGAKATAIVGAAPGLKPGLLKASRGYCLTLHPEHLSSGHLTGPNSRARASNPVPSQGASGGPIWTRGPPRPPGKRGACLPDTDVSWETEASKPVAKETPVETKTRGSFRSRQRLALVPAGGPERPPPAV